MINSNTLKNASAFMVLCVSQLAWASTDDCLSTGEMTPPKVVCNIAWGCKTTTPLKEPHCASAKLALINSQIENGTSTVTLNNFKDFARPSFFIGPLKVSLSSAISIPAPITIPDTTRANAEAILAELDKQPLDESTQGKARAAVINCKVSLDILSMYQCSGLFVPPLVRMNCINNGPCLPLPWGSVAVANGSPNWWKWQTYTTISEPEMVAIGRPWITTPSEANKCAVASNEAGTMNQDKFSLCMVKKMGGPNAQIAMKCYSMWNADPARFAGCLNGISISETISKQVDCVITSGGVITGECAKIMGVSNNDAKNCISIAAGDAAKLNTCLVAAAPRRTSLVVDCTKVAGGDASLLGHCLKGVTLEQASPYSQKIERCLEVGDSAGKPQSVELQMKVLECGAVGNTGATALLNTAKSSKVLIDCVSDPAASANTKVKCLQAQGVKLPDQVALANCLTTAKDGIDAAKCAGVEGAAQIKIAQQCFNDAQGDTARQALCIGAQVGLPPDQARLVSCAATAQSYSSGAVCMVGPYLNKDAARALDCVAGSQGSPAGTVICLAGPSMNAELRIASECLATSGGVPLTFAACAGGRLAMKELQQCISGGFKSENGCMGENNEIVKYFNSQEKALRGVMKAAGLEPAYNNVLNDLKNGRLGENNDARKVFETINRITLQDPVKATEGIIRDAAQAGRQIVGGAVHLQQEVTKAHQQVADAIKNALPAVSGNIGGVSVTVGPTGASAGNNNTGATVNTNGSGNVRVGGVKICTPWGC